MNFLILGGNGYIGSKVARLLLLEGHSVVSTKRVTSDISRLKDFEKVIKWIPASVDGVESAMQYMRFDYVLNMACNYGRTNVLYDGVIEANIEFPLRVLNSAVKHGTKKYLTIGTGLPENLNMYSFSKNMFSEFGNFYVEKHNINFNSLLLEMFYSSDEPQDRFIPSIISKMIKGELVETTVGTQRRDVIAAEDVVKAIKIVIDSNLNGFNEIQVGTGISPTISEIVDYIWLHTGKKSIIKKGAMPMRIDEPDCVADTSKLKALGEWNPMPWKEGILRMINEMRDTMILI